MKLNVVTNAMVSFSQTTQRVESWYQLGFVELVSIQCEGCGAWVEVSGWDPEAGTCDWCASRSVRRMKVAARRRRRRGSRAGGA